MSSAKLQTPPADAGATLRQAFVEVCENSFFAFVEPCTPERFAALISQAAEARAAAGTTQSEWLRASVGFTGAFSGAVEVALPEPLATSLVGALLGEEIDCPMPEHWMFDGVGEFANMVCGAWLTALNSSQAFELRSPAVTRMSTGWSPAADSMGDDERSHRLVINDHPVRIRFRASAGA
jgi:CheY-specific phosphatase CheX